jgi:hypothetical protein
MAFKLKIESMALLKDGSVSIDGILTFAFGMTEKTQIIVDKASWEKCVKNATRWHSS